MLAQKVSTIGLEEESNNLRELLDKNMKQVQETTDKLESDMLATSRQLAVFEDAITKQVDDKIME